MQELAAVFPSLSELSVDVSGSRVAADRYRFHYAVRAVLERFAARQAVLLALDDVHWADPASFDVSRICCAGFGVRCWWPWRFGKPRLGSRAR